MASPSYAVIAECPACGERRFRAPCAAPERSDVLSCASCGLKLTYGFIESRAPKPSLKPKPKRKAPARAKARGGLRRR